MPTGGRTVRTVPTGLAIAGACCSAAIAFWLAPASVQIASWPRGGAGLIALFAPLRRLWWALGGALLATVAVWFAGHPSDAERDERRFVIAPLAALWIWAIPFVPWLAARFPLTLVFAGPLRWLLAASVAVAVAARWLRARGRTAAMPPLPGRKTDRKSVV